MMHLFRSALKESATTTNEQSVPCIHMYNIATPMATPTCENNLVREVLTSYIVTDVPLCMTRSL